MSEFTSINLSQLDAPEVVETLSYDAVLEEMKAALAIELGNRDWDMPSEPLVKLLEIVAYRELLIRQRVNVAAKQTMLAYAQGSNLDHLAALLNVERQEDEDDTRFRARTQLALEGYSTAGPEGAYIYHVLAASNDVKDVSVEAPKFEALSISDELRAQLPADAVVFRVVDDAGLVDPLPSDVALTVLSNIGSGQSSANLLDVVSEYLDETGVRPIADRVQIRSSAVKSYSIDAVLDIYPGPDASIVIDGAVKAAQQYVLDQHRNGRNVELSAIYAALHQYGVRRVVLNSPAQTIECTPREAAYCTGIDVRLGVQDG